MEIQFFNSIFFWKNYFKDLLKIFFIELKETIYYLYLKLIILYSVILIVIFILGVNVVFAVTHEAIFTNHECSIYPGYIVQLKEHLYLDVGLIGALSLVSFVTNLEYLYLYRLERKIELINALIKEKRINHGSRFIFNYEFIRICKQRSDILKKSFIILLILFPIFLYFYLPLTYFIRLNTNIFSHGLTGIIEKMPVNEINFFNSMYFWKKYFKDLLKIFFIELKEKVYYYYLKAVIFYPGLCTIFLIIGINIVFRGITKVDAVDLTEVESAWKNREISLWMHHCRWQENWVEIIEKGHPTKDEICPDQTWEKLRKEMNLVNLNFWQADYINKISRELEKEKELMTVDDLLFEYLVAYDREFHKPAPNNNVLHFLYQQIHKVPECKAFSIALRIQSFEKPTIVDALPLLKQQLNEELIFSLTSKWEVSGFWGQQLDLITSLIEENSKDFVERLDKRLVMSYEQKQQITSDIGFEELILIHSLRQNFALNIDDLIQAHHGSRVALQAAFALIDNKFKDDFEKYGLNNYHILGKIARESVRLSFITSHLCINETVQTDKIALGITKYIQKLINRESCVTK
jgi:hypothetical protein